MIELIQIVNVYKRLLGNMQRQSELVLELCGHPEATDEQIVEAAKSLQRTRAGLLDLNAKLLEKYPNSKALKAAFSPR